MTTIAKRIRRIDVWPTFRIAHAADTAVSRYVGRLTVWPTSALAEAHRRYPAGEQLMLNGMNLRLGNQDLVMS